MRRLGLALLATLVLSLVVAACGSEPAEPTVVEVEKVVTVVVPGETVIETVVEKVEVPGETVVKEVVKEVPVEVVVEKEVVREIVKEVPKEVVVEKEVVKEVPVEVVVEKEVVREIVKEVPKEVVVVKEVPVKERQVLRFSVNFAPGNMNPMDGGEPKELVWPLWSKLANADPVAKEYVGDLAERIEQAADGTSFTFHLRENAMWHDGQPVTAEDIAYTFRMFLNPATGSRMMGKLALIKGAEAYTKGEADDVSGITVLDDKTIRFDQEFPNSLFMTPATQLIVLPSHILGDVPPDQLRGHQYWQNPIASGPFKFASHVEGQFFRLVANEDYYLGPPQVDEIVTNIILSSEAAQIAFQRGEIHSMSFDGGTDATTEMFESAIADPGANVMAEEGSTLISYAMNSRKEDLTDPRLRQAFLYALDRQKLIDTFVGGNGKIFDSFMTHSWYQKPEFKKYDYNPDKARELLKEMGWDSNREIECTIITVSSEEARAMLAAEQQMLAEVGIKLKFKEVALSVWVDTFYTTYDWDSIRVTFGVFPDPDGFLSFHLKTGSRNAMGYANPELDAKIEKGRRETDLDKRRAIYQEINDEMTTTLPLQPVYLKDFWTIVSNRWYVPGISDMRPATSLSDMPTYPIFGAHGEVFSISPHLWEVR